ATPMLDHLNVPYDSPPAFLLDAHRRSGTGIAMNPGDFDNRSVSLPTDLPSANMLLSCGIRKAILIQETASAPQPDLAHTLLRWQQAAIQILAASTSDPNQLTPIAVAKPSMFKLMFQRLTATMGLRRSPLGGFGGYLPDVSSGG